MEKNLVGYRFDPTGEELINHYLKNKILGKSWLVDDAISEINICTYDPIYLPSLSKIQSKDPVWYFFSPREYTSGKKKKGTKRTTVSGYWKATGVDRKIKYKRGNREIGIKKTLVYYQGRVPNGVWTPWVMHEYHITCLPLDQRTYVICQVMYKGEEGDILYGNSNLSLPQPSQSPVVEQQQGEEDDLFTLSVDDLLNLTREREDLSPSLGFNPDTLLSDYNNNNHLEDFSPCDGFNPDTFFSDSNNNEQPQTPYDNNGMMGFNGEGIEDVFSYELVMQENRNNHMAKKPLTGIVVDYSSDSDAESISATSYQGTSSPNDSVGSSSQYSPSCSNTDSFKDVQTSADPSINQKNRESQLTLRTIPSRQEVKESKSKAVSASIEKKSSMATIEKKGWFIKEEAMERNRKNPRYIYLMNMIVGSVLLVALLATPYRFY